MNTKLTLNRDSTIIEEVKRHLQTSSLKLSYYHVGSILQSSYMKLIIT